ncbi:MAG: hypothetical protein R2880_14675 [Deinococcales bacterium]
MTCLVGTSKLIPKGVQSSARRFQRAYCAGFITFLALWLGFSLFVSPLLSSQQDFAHVHPHGTAFHFHALHNIWGFGHVAERIDPQLSWQRLESSSPPWQEPYLKELISKGYHSRAPPLISL